MRKTSNPKGNPLCDSRGMDFFGFEARALLIERLNAPFDAI